MMQWLKFVYMFSITDFIVTSLHYLLKEHSIPVLLTLYRIV